MCQETIPGGDVLDMFGPFSYNRYTILILFRLSQCIFRTPCDVLNDTCMFLEMNV